MLKGRSTAVLGFGWLGAQTRHMNSISKLYDKLGLDFKWMIQSPLSLLNLKDDIKSFNDMYNYSKNKSVVLHIFSLNGAQAAFRSLLNENWTPKRDVNIRGVIWDSAPGIPDNDTYHKAFASAIFPNTALLRNVTAAALLPVFKIFLCFGRKQMEQASRRLDFLYNNPLPYPQLIMTSKNDTILPYETTQLYADAAKRRGYPTTLKIFDKSGHVKLWWDYRDEYSRYVSDFLHQIDVL